MVLTPMFVTFTLCLGLVLSAMLRVQSMYLAQNLAEYCALADFRDEMLSAHLEQIRPSWVSVDSIECFDEGDVVRLSLGSSVTRAPIPAQKIEWFATSERQ